jgi:hypothetical protein
MPDADLLTGYAHPAYAGALSEFGTPRRLAESGATILQRPVPGFPDDHDAMGCYPLFSCPDWSKLETDLERLEGELVCLSVVTDPFGEYDVASLRRAFPDLVRPFKTHYVVDLRGSGDEFVASHHRRNARKALEVVAVEECEEPRRWLSEWEVLYDHLAARHGITGVRAFSRASFAKQLEVPGIRAFRAVCAGRTVGMLLWYVQDGVAYYHLGAHSDEGYEVRASFALFRWAIDRFRAEGTKWLNLGSGAGLADDPSDGLSRFKRGWSTGTRTAYLCGRILHRERYTRILTELAITDTDFFPAYRRTDW